MTHPDTQAACLEHPELGGMGRHFLDPSLADDEAVHREAHGLLSDDIVEVKEGR